MPNCLEVPGLFNGRALILVTETERETYIHGMVACPPGMTHEEGLRVLDEVYTQVTEEVQNWAYDHFFAGLPQNFDRVEFSRWREENVG